MGIERISSSVLGYLHKADSLFLCKLVILKLYERYVILYMYYYVNKGDYMKKISRRILSFVLSVVLLATTLGFVFVANATTTTTPGPNLTYSFDSSTGTFTISGTGDMYDFRDTSIGTNRKAPWTEIKDQIKTVIIGEGVTGIGDYSFFKCVNLTKVQLPSTLKEIRGFGASGGAVASNTGSYGAFRECTSLVEIVFPEGLEKIEPVAFRECTSLKRVVLPDSLTSLGTAAFVNCTGISSVTFGSGITEIPTEAFYQCSNLSEINWGPNVQKVGGWAFYGTRLTAVEIPEHITEITARAFADCYHLYDATIYNRECSIADLSFNNEKLTKPQEFNVHGYSGSTAQTFAEKKSYTFIPLEDCSHVNTHTSITVAPTCTEQGNMALICDDCGVTVSNTVLDATGHSYPDGQDIVRDDTAVDGHIRTFQTCSVCGYENVILEHAKLGTNEYVWVEGYYTYRNTATCTRSGTETYTCTVDGCRQIEAHVVQKGGHQCEWQTTKQATCTTDGEKTGHCTVCDTDVTEVIPAIGHDLDTSVIINSEDKTIVDGHVYNYYRCKNCNENVCQMVHTAWIDGEYTPNVISRPTCTVDGLQRDTCDICGETRNVTLKANGEHVWEETTTVEPTCTSQGQTNYKCANCELTKKDTVPALGHDYQIVTESCMAPTCTDSGYNTYKCSRCSASRQDTIDPLGHTSNPYYYVETKTADCENDGAATSKCTVCSADYSIIIPALGHDYIDVETQIPEDEDKPGHVLVTPTCQRAGCNMRQTATVKHVEWIEGYYTHTVVTEGTCVTGEISTDQCTVCSEVRANNEGRPLGHEYRFVRVIHKNNISLPGGTEGEGSGSGSIGDIIGGIGGDSGVGNIETPTIKEYSIIYICKHCSKTENILGEDVYKMWDIYYYNRAPEGRLGENNSSYMDVTGDNIINAKDYALIYNLHKEYQQAQAEQTQ